MERKGVIKQFAQSYVRNQFTDGSWERAYKEVFEVCDRVYRNNEYLLSKYGKNKKQQRKEWRDNFGLSISPAREDRIRNGLMKTVSMYTLEFVALFWGISLIELISRDYYAEQSLKIASGEMGNERVIPEWTRRGASKERRKANAKPIVREKGLDDGHEGNLP